MANYATLKAAIQQVVKTNGNEEITGALLQQSLLAMINSLGDGFQYMGIATPTTNPGTPDQNVFYLASTAGTYANFGSLALADGEIAILKYNGAWFKDLTGAASLEKVNQLRQDVDALLGVTRTQATIITDLTATLYKDGYYIGNGSPGTTLGEEKAYAGRAIYTTLGWKLGDIIRVDYLRSAGISSCAIATYKNGVIVENLLNGSASGEVVNTPTDFTPSLDFDEVRFSLQSNDASKVVCHRVETIMVATSAVIDALNDNVSTLDENVDILNGDILDVQDGTVSTRKNPTLYKNGYYIGNGVGTILGGEVVGATRAIWSSTGWKKGDIIRISYLNAAGSSSCAIAIYKNGSFVKNILSGVNAGGVVVSTQTDYAPTEDYDEVRFSLASNNSANISGLVCIREKKVSQVIEDIKDDIAELKTDEPLKVLLIGSSFGVNTIIQFPFICKGAGINVICGDLYESGGTLQDIVNIINGTNTWDNAKLFLPDVGLWANAPSTDFDDMLEYTDWDVIILQRAASERTSWNNTMASNLQTIVEYIRLHTTNSPQILFNPTFAYPSFTTNKTSQVTETDNINASVKQMQDAFGFEIIPVATAVQNARMTNLIGFGSVAETIPDMAEDSMHLDTGVGSYVTGAVLFEYIIGKRFGKSIIANPYIPVKTDITSMGIFAGTAYTQPTADNINVMKYCALLACRNPETISTEIGERYPYGS